MCYVNDDATEDELAELRQYGEVVQVPERPDVLSGNLAKISRWIEASKRGEEFCMIADADFAPLHRDYWLSVADIAKSDNFLALGFDAYHNQCIRSAFPRFPAGYCMSTGNTFQDLINKHHLSDEALIESGFVYDDILVPWSGAATGPSPHIKNL